MPKTTWQVDRKQNAIFPGLSINYHCTEVAPLPTGIAVSTHVSQRCPYRMAMKKNDFYAIYVYMFSALPVTLCIKYSRYIYNECNMCTQIIRSKLAKFMLVVLPYTEPGLLTLPNKHMEEVSNKLL